MITVTDNETGISRTFADDLLPHICLEVAGGGYTTKQTTVAMTLQAAVARDGTVKTRKATITREQAE